MPPPRIQAGQLRHRVEFVQPTLAQDSFGGTRIDQVSSVATLWGFVETLRGQELYAAQQKVSEVTHRITLHANEAQHYGITAQMNAQINSPGPGGPTSVKREFPIQAVDNPDERPHVVYLLCIERDTSARETAGVVT